MEKFDGDVFNQDVNPEAAALDEHLDELEADLEARWITLGIPERDHKFLPTIKRSISSFIGGQKTFLLELAFDEDAHD